MDTLHDFHAALLAPIARNVSAEAGVKRLVRAHVGWVVKHPDRASLLHKLKRGGEVTDASESVGAANEQAFGVLRAWIRRKTEAREMRALPFHLWMAVVFAPTMSLSGRWVSNPRSPVTTRVRAALEHAAWSAVAP